MGKSWRSVCFQKLTQAWSSNSKRKTVVSRICVNKYQHANIIYWIDGINALTVTAPISIHVCKIFPDLWGNTFSFQLVLSFLGSSWFHCPLSGRCGSALCWNAMEKHFKKCTVSCFLLCPYDLICKCEELILWKNASIQNLMFPSVWLGAYILGESLERLSSTDPLTGGAMS